MPCLFLSLFLIFKLAAQVPPPIAPIRNVTDDYFGTKITDPYRWMEDWKSKETQDWMKAQAEYADDYFRNLPLRDELLQRLGQTTSASVSIYDIRQRGPYYFYQRRGPDESDYKLVCRKGLDGAERILADPARISSPGKRYSIDSYEISWEGKYVFYSAFPSGNEISELRVVETETGKDIGEWIYRAATGGWLPGEKAILYTSSKPIKIDGSDPIYKRRIYMHLLGTDPDKDRPVFGVDVDPNLKIDSSFAEVIHIPHGSRYAFAELTTAVGKTSVFYMAPIDSLTQSPVPWRKIADVNDEIGGLWLLNRVTVQGDYLYLISGKDTPRSKVIRIPIDNPDLTKAETVFPASEAIVQSIAASTDALYITTLNGGRYEIWRVDYKSKRSELMKMPYPGSRWLSTPGVTNDTDMIGAFVFLNTWTRSQMYLKYDPKTKTLTDTKLIPPAPIDMSSITEETIRVPSYDGTLVPLAIIHKRGLKLNGTNPVLLWGYGAYGLESTSPRYLDEYLPWLERGGVVAFAGVRGGGEFGEEWHMGGFKKTKPNTWKDFIACAEYLIKKKYTSPQHLGVQGWSAGGILMGNAIAERPELFGAAVIQFGINDPVRYDTTPNGKANIPEFGSTGTEDGFRTLLAMDGYLKIKDGINYPALLVTAGINDRRVEPWMSAKMAARIRAATSGTKPVLFRIDYDAGHAGGRTKEQTNRETADIYAFLFEQLK